VLYVGRVAHEKSLHMLPALVDAVNGPAGGEGPSRETTQFVVVGAGPALEELQAACAGKRVHFCGQIPHGGELARLYASADAFFSPSCFETLGQVFLESMASGVPVVAAGAAGALEVFANGVEGYHFKPGDAEDAAALLRRACALRRCVATPALVAGAGLAPGGAPPPALDSSPPGPPGPPAFLQDNDGLYARSTPDLGPSEALAFLLRARRLATQRSWAASYATALRAYQDALWQNALSDVGSASQVPLSPKVARRSSARWWGAPSGKVEGGKAAWR